MGRRSFVCHFAYADCRPFKGNPSFATICNPHIFLQNFLSEIESCCVRTFARHKFALPLPLREAPACAVPVTSRHYTGRRVATGGPWTTAVHSHLCIMIFLFAGNCGFSELVVVTFGQEIVSFLVGPLLVSMAVWRH